MNFWLLTTEYPPFHGGGISTYCRNTAKMLAAGGVNVTVFVPDDSIQDYKTEENGEVRLIRFNSDRSRKSACLGYAARLSHEFAEIVRLMLSRGERPDIIEAQDYLGIAYYLLYYKHLLYEDVKDIPIILTLHSPAFLYLEYNRVPTFRFPDFHTCQMEKEAIKMADHLISPTHYLVEAIRPYVAIPDEAVTIIRNPFTGSSARRFPVIRNKIVYYGKLSPQKGSFELLKYFKKLWDAGFSHPLYIVGGTDIVYHPERLTMGQLADRDYGDYIRKGLLIFRGKIRPSVLEDELGSAHLIIVPSVVDNLPYVVIEAMSLGKIVLASVQGGQREMIDDRINGFLFDHHLPGDFERQLSRILALQDDQIAAIGESAKEKLKSMYDATDIVRKKLTLVDNLIQRIRPGTHFPFLHQERYEPPAGKVKGNGKLSVVIPYYNMGKYILDSVRSVQASTYAETEILIIDDGSNERESTEMLQQLARMKGVRIYRKENSGLAETRNFGAGQATGEYLAFLDADDQVSPDYYEKAIRVLRPYENVFFAGCWTKYFGSSRQLWVGYTPQPPYILAHNSLNSSSLVYKKEAFLRAGLNDKLVDYGLEDYESVISLMAAGYNGIVLPEFLFQYQVRSDSMFRKITREKLLYSYKYIAEKHAGYYAKFASDIVNLLNANGPGFIYDNPTFGVAVYSKPENNNWWLIKLKAVVKRNKFLKRIALKLNKII